MIISDQSSPPIGKEAGLKQRRCDWMRPRARARKYGHHKVVMGHQMERGKGGSRAQSRRKSLPCNKLSRTRAPLYPLEERPGSNDIASLFPRAHERASMPSGAPLGHDHEDANHAQNRHKYLPDNNVARTGTARYTRSPPARTRARKYASQPRQRMFTASVSVR
jgi:hypothetical protein